MVRCPYRIDSQLQGGILLANLAMRWVANRYSHYFTVFVPVYVVLLGRYLPAGRKRLILLAVAVCIGANLLFAAHDVGTAVEDCYLEGSSRVRYEAIAADAGRIPAEERGSVIGYNIPAADYLQAGLTPCHKYYTFQPKWARVDPSIMTDFMTWLDTERPCWVLTSPYEGHDTLLSILDDGYELRFSNDYLAFYRLK